MFVAVEGVPRLLLLRPCLSVCLCCSLARCDPVCVALPPVYVSGACVQEADTCCDVDRGVIYLRESASHGETGCTVHIGSMLYDDIGQQDLHAG